MLLSHLSTTPKPETASNFSQLSAPQTVARDMFIPDVLSPEAVRELVDICRGPLRTHFMRNLKLNSPVADIDEIRMIEKGDPHDYSQFPEEERNAYETVFEIGFSKPVVEALHAFSPGTHSDLIIQEFLFILMGEGTSNASHNHPGLITANILLQDIPRKEGSAAGLYFTLYYAKEGEQLENDVYPDLLAGVNMHRHYFETPPGGMHARLGDVLHGVAPIPGERAPHPDFDKSRLVLTYVFPDLSRVAR